MSATPPVLGNPSVEAKLNDTGSGGVFVVTDSGSPSVFLVETSGDVKLFGELRRQNTGLIIETGSFSPILNVHSAGKGVELTYEPTGQRLAIETGENLGIVANNGLFISRTGSSNEFLVCDVGGQSRLVGEYDGPLGRVTVRTDGSSGEQDDDLFVESEGRLHIKANQAELRAEAATTATVEAGGNVRLESTGGRIDLDAQDTIRVDSDKALDLLANETVDLTFGDDGQGMASLRIHVKNPFSGGLNNLFKITAHGNVEFAFSDHATGGSSVSAQVRPHDIGNVANSFDSAVETGLGDDTRGVVIIKNEPNANNKRAGVLTLFDQDGVPWFLWAGSNGKLYMSGTDPQTLDQSPPDLVAGQ